MAITRQPLVRSTSNWYAASWSKGAQSTMRTFAYLKKHGRHWPKQLSTNLTWLTEVDRNETRWACSTHGPKVCKNFERNRPLVGANEFFGSVITWCFYISTQYAYHLIDLRIMNNFASRTIGVNHIVH